MLDLTNYTGSVVELVEHVLPAENTWFCFREDLEISRWELLRTETKHGVRTT